MRARDQEVKIYNLTSVTLGIDTTSVSGSSSFSLGSGLGSAAALIFFENMRKVRSTRNPLINMH